MLDSNSEIGINSEIIPYLSRNQNQRKEKAAQLLSCDMDILLNWKVPKSVPISSRMRWTSESP